jgi:hypothetical protein
LIFLRTRIVILRSFDELRIQDDAERLHRNVEFVILSLSKDEP